MGQNGVGGVLDKECVGSENGTADVTFCPFSLEGRGQH